MKSSMAASLCSKNDARQELMNVEPDSGPLSFAIEELGKKDRRWRLEIRPSDLALFEGDDPHPYVILREQFPNDAVFEENIRALVLKKPKKVMFKLTPEATSAVADWIGKSLLACLCLKSRYVWVLPVAIIWIIGSLPIAGNPESGVQAQPFDVMGFGLGVGLLIAWAFAKWRPHPLLFLVDSMWCLCLAGYLINDVVHGRSKLWLILAALLLWMVVTGFKYFRRFRGTRLTPASMP
jgi:hypothetical protein